MHENNTHITVDLNKPLSAEALARMDALEDRHIDYSDIPPLSDELLKEMSKRPRPVTKKPVSIRLDPDIIEFFKKEDVHYQSRINSVLRGYVDAMRV